MLTGSLHEESRGALEDLHVLAQPPVLPPQHGELLALLAGQPAVATRAGVPLGLAHPLAHRGLGQIEVPGDLPDRAVTTLAQLNDLGLELCGERPSRARHLALVAFHDLHDGHPLRGNAPDRGCPSKRVKLKQCTGGAQSQVVKSCRDDAPAFVPKTTMQEPLPESCQKLCYS